ncbi:MAG TPA: hypothetical protein PKE16_17560, partial [Hyphomicrobium sp.]|nr:hypothetical protein [Hyphomicrobium sp.]
MTIFVNLDRRFHDLSEKELGDPDYLASLNEFQFGPKTSWPELICSKRVVILAEAGSGKTREMEEQARSMTAEGNFAFFSALERIAHEGFEGTLPKAERARLDAWLAEDNVIGWFFLDAVDELKLTAGKLDDALRRFADAIDGSLHRAHVVISCRPYDWRPTMDAAVVDRRLAVVREDPPPAPVDPEEFFLEPLRRDKAAPASGSTSEPSEPEHVFGLRVVVLLPMGYEQIRKFATSLGVADAPDFLEAIARQNAWIFARRPLDLIELAASWRESRRLGTRAEQHEANITNKLRDDPERADRGVLDDVKARDGAERLALGLVLTRTRTIRSPNQPLDGGRPDAVLDPRVILKHWSEGERQTLLRRALFDPATYGRVRFHHRSVQEYLAARRLKALRDKGMTVKALFRLLFAESYGSQVVLPSMRAVAAWLALWDDDVRQELTAREPESLLSEGDPESFDMLAREALLRAFASAYEGGGWRGLEVPIDEVRRLAHPDLAAVTRELWGCGPANPELKELLIET